MARQSERLTARRVATITKPGRYGDGHGLILQVSKTGVKSWLLRYQRGQRERWLGLGAAHTVGLKEARERARRARLQLLDGIDPIDQRRAEKRERALAAAKHINFEEAARAYYAANESNWSNAKVRETFLRSLGAYVFPHIGRLSVADIDTGLVLKCIEPIWVTKNETARKVHRRVQAVLAWSIASGRRPGPNPAEWRNHLDKLLPAPSRVQSTEHFPAMRFEDVPGFVPELRGRHGVAARALEFLILSAARTGEVIGARWGEVDLDKRVWTIPAGRSKTGKPHRVPLSDRAVEILRELPREDGNDHVFISPTKKGAGLSNMAMATILKKLHAARARAGLPPWADRESGKLASVHGFRSCFRDWAAERTAYPNHVVEKALAHSIGNGVEEAYRRGDLFEKRRRLMRDWAKNVETLAQAGADVVPIRAAR